MKINVDIVGIWPHNIVSRKKCQQTILQNHSQKKKIFFFIKEQNQMDGQNMGEYHMERFFRDFKGNNLLFFQSHPYVPHNLDSYD